VKRKATEEVFGGENVQVLLYEILMLMPNLANKSTLTRALLASAKKVR